MSVYFLQWSCHWWQVFAVWHELTFFFPAANGTGWFQGEAYAWEWLESCLGFNFWAGNFLGGTHPSWVMDALDTRHWILFGYKLLSLAFPYYLHDFCIVISQCSATWWYATCQWYLLLFVLCNLPNKEGKRFIMHKGGRKTAFLGLMV